MNSTADGPPGSSPVRALVIQMGARRDYEVARMLDGCGALAALHTDAAWTEGAVDLKLARQLFPGRAAALSRRTVRSVPAAAIWSTLTPNLVGGALSLAKVNAERRFRVEDWFLGLNVRRVGLGDANTVVSVAGNGGIGFLRWARRRGMKIAADVVITPLVHEILAVERQLWPKWTDETDSAASRRIYREHIQSLAEVCHRLIVPSDFVAEGLTAIAPGCDSKIVKVPYALGAMSIAQGTPTPGRVLFAGEASIRKGLPYLGLAASRLRGAHPEIEVRVAGRATDWVRTQDETRDLRFLGHLRVDEMKREFALADVFVLPSLAEGMASVALEALAHGVPCVVTRASGAPIEHGVNGCVVPERDPEALAEAVAGIVGDRARRKAMSVAALATARRHELNNVAQAMHAALAEMHVGGEGAPLSFTTTKGRGL